MDAGGMMTVTTYRLRAASSDDLHAALVAASEGKARAYAWLREDGSKRFDKARVRPPYEETSAGAAVEVTDPDGGTYTVELPQATGLWLCEVALVDETDADLAAVAVGIWEEIPD